MACTNPCVQGDRSNVTLSLPRITPSGPVKAGQTVTISIDVTDVSWVLGETVIVDVTDMDNGSCIYNEGIPWLGKGQTKIISFQVIMPDKNLNLRISASSWVVGIIPLPSYWSCEDVREFSIEQQYTKYNCGSSGVCVGPLQSGQFNSREECIASGCAAPAPPAGNGGITPTQCPSDQMNIFGACYKKNDVLLIGAAIVGFMILSR